MFPVHPRTQQKSLIKEERELMRFIYACQIKNNILALLYDKMLIWKGEFGSKVSSFL